MKRVPYRAWLLIVFLVVWAISAINPHDRFDFALEHSPTAAFIIWLVIYDRRSVHGPLSNLSCTLLFIFMLLHVLGAHYLYSNVPYDQWSEVIFGRSISDMFGWERNHYDRLVHFLFGVLCLYPIHEVVMRYGTRNVIHSLIVSILGIVFVGAVYEWAEWLLSVFMSPEAAENYNGQQGDIFDPHKDTFLAFIGSLIVAPITWVRSRGRASAHRPATGPDRGR